LYISTPFYWEIRSQDKRAGPGRFDDDQTGGIIRPGTALRAAT
jgi:hypothetical protein